MYAMIPVYYPSIETASKQNEMELWRESRNINLDCKRFIEDRASTAYNTRELDLFIKDLVEQYGVERAMYVLSRTVQYKQLRRVKIFIPILTQFKQLHYM